MNIVLGEENVGSIQDRYIVLELDSLKLPGSTDPVKSYCIVEQIGLEEMTTVENYRDLHQNLIKNYRERNWNFCDQAIEHLVGRWNGKVDSFYQDLSRRVQKLKSTDPGPDWDPVIDKT